MKRARSFTRGFACFVVVCIGCESGYGDGGSVCGDDIHDEEAGLCWQEPAWASLAWQDAIDACEGLVRDGRDDWRLPTRDELTALLGGCDGAVESGEAGYCAPCGSSDRCAALFPGDVGWYWTGTPYGGAMAWGVGFESGRVGYDFAGESNIARCVRADR